MRWMGEPHGMPCLIALESQHEKRKVCVGTLATHDTYQNERQRSGNFPPYIPVHREAEMLSVILTLMIASAYCGDLLMLWPYIIDRRELHRRSVRLQPIIHAV